jgi:hypothetical protein
MALNFLNESRSYNSSHQYITFWGYDSAFEVTFRLDHTALQQFSGLDNPGEDAALQAFDANISRIRLAAQTIYKGKRDRYFELSAKDV